MQPSFWFLVLITIGLGLGTFIQILDTSIANVAIPNIAGDLGVSPTVGSWVITSFAVSNAIVLPLTGWLSSLFGQVRLFVWSTGLFAVASFLCGIAWDFHLLVFFRVIQGAVAGCLIPLSQGLLLNNYPEHQKGLALGFWAMIVIVAPVVGPVLGGYLTDNYGWPWIFYINVPIGLISCFIVWKTLQDDSAEKQNLKIDYLGLFLLVVGVSALQITLDKGQELDWFHSDFIRITSVTAFLGLLYFCIWNYFSSDPVVNFDFFKLRNYVISLIACSLGFLVFFGSTVLLPLWLQTQQGYTAFKAGVAVTPIGIIPLILAPLIGKFMYLVDTRWLVTFSFLVFGITFIWLGQLNTEVSLTHIVIIRIFQGLGLAFFFIPLIDIALSQISNKDLSSSSGVYNFIRLVMGGGFGTAIFITLWQRREIFHRAIINENLTPYNPAVQNMLEQIKTLGIDDLKAAGVLEKMIQQQSYLLAFNDCCWLSGWIFFGLIPIVWLSTPALSINKGKVVIAAE